MNVTLQHPSQCRITGYRKKEPCWAFVECKRACSVNVWIRVDGESDKTVATGADFYPSNENLFCSFSSSGSQKA